MVKLIVCGLVLAGPEPIVKLCVTRPAAACAASPAWSPKIVQVPSAKSDTTAPVTEQIPLLAGARLNVTVSPEDATAAIV